MSDWMSKVLESKRENRKKLAALPFSAKIELLEKLRDRSLLISSSHLRKIHKSVPAQSEHAHA